MEAININSRYLGRLAQSLLCFFVLLNAALPDESHAQAPATWPEAVNPFLPPDTLVLVQSFIRFYYSNDRFPLDIVFRASVADGHPITATCRREEICVVEIFGDIGDYYFKLDGDPKSYFLQGGDYTVEVQFPPDLEFVPGPDYDDSQLLAKKPVVNGNTITLIYNSVAHALSLSTLRFRPKKSAPSTVTLGLKLYYRHVISRTLIATKNLTISLDDLTISSAVASPLGLLFQENVCERGRECPLWLGVEIPNALLTRRPEPEFKVYISYPPTAFRYISSQLDNPDIAFCWNPPIRIIDGFLRIDGSGFASAAFSAQFLFFVEDAAPEFVDVEVEVRGFETGNRAEFSYTISRKVVRVRIRDAEVPLAIPLDAVKMPMN